MEFFLTILDVCRTDLETDHIIACNEYTEFFFDKDNKLIRI